MKRWMGPMVVLYGLLHASTASALDDGDPSAPGGTGEPAPSCASVTANAPFYAGTYSCDLTLTDSYSRPRVGAPVTFTLSWCNKFGVKTVATATGTTDATGHAYLTTPMASLGANRATCSVAAPDPINVAKTVTSATRFTTGTTVVGPFAASHFPQPDATYSPPGLRAGVGRADLFRSGAYDKVVILPEYFDPNEHSFSNRNRVRFWKELKQLLVEELYNNGWDVWVFQPYDTGQNLHEQAAELAQTIRYAANAYQTPSCGSNKVSLFGLSTAGVVARIATARWESDPAWLSWLGIPSTATLPVNLIATGDAPNYGMHLNLAMQQAMWEKQSGQQIYETTNLDSCAANQLLRKRTDFPSGTTTANFLAFFVNGTSATYYSKKDKVIYTCEAGPAVATMNAVHGVPGWPSAPLRVGFSNGAAAFVNECYGKSPWFDLDLDANGAGNSVCPYMSEVTMTSSYAPKAGDAWMHIAIEGADDQYWTTEAEDTIAANDVEAGSRNPLVIAGNSSWSKVCFFGDCLFGGSVQLRQRFSPTLMPYRSASGTEGPVTGNAYATRTAPWSTPPASESEEWSWHQNQRSGVADVPYEGNFAMVLDRLNDQGALCPPVVVNGGNTK